MNIQLNRSLFLGNIETSIGVLNLAKPKELPHFVAICNSMRRNNVIVYQSVLLNKGGGMNGDNGRFNVPKTGIYR